MSLRQALDLGVVHVHVKDPIPDVVSLSSIDQVLLWKRNFKWRWNVSVLEIRVIVDSIVIWILNSIVQVKISVEEHEGHIVNSFSPTGFSCVQESLISSNLLGVSQQGSAKFG